MNPLKFKSSCESLNKGMCCCSCVGYCVRMGVQMESKVRHSPDWWSSHVLLCAGPPRLFFSSSVVLDQPHRLLPNLHSGRGHGHVLQSRSFCHLFSLQLCVQSVLSASSFLSISFTVFAQYLIDNILLSQLGSHCFYSGQCLAEGTMGTTF